MYIYGTVECTCASKVCSSEDIPSMFLATGAHLLKTRRRNSCSCVLSIVVTSQLVFLRDVTIMEAMREKVWVLVWANTYACKMYIFIPAESQKTRDPWGVVQIANKAVCGDITVDVAIGNCGRSRVNYFAYPLPHSGNARVYTCI